MKLKLIPKWFWQVLYEPAESLHAQAIDSQIPMQAAALVIGSKNGIILPAWLGQ